MRLTPEDHSFGCPEAGRGRPGALAARVKWRKAALLAVFVGCGEPTEPPDGVFIFDFDRGFQGFTAGFADYPKGQEDFFELTSGHRAIPSPLGSRSGLFISGNNRSDDLFMFFKGRIDGLIPGARYDIEVSWKSPPTRLRAVRVLAARRARASRSRRERPQSNRLRSVPTCA